MIYVHAYVCIYIYIYTYLSLSLYIYIYMCICTCVCIYTYMYIRIVQNFTAGEFGSGGKRGGGAVTFEKFWCSDRQPSAQNDKGNLGW